MKRFWSLLLALMMILSLSACAGEGEEVTETTESGSAEEFEPAPDFTVYDKDGKPIKWQVENSWGDESGDKGFFVMSDEWFGEFAYQILLDRSYFSAEQNAQFDAEPILLAPWDPMGSLA